MGNVNCSECGGEGRMAGWYYSARRTVYRTVKCPVCKGRGTVTSRTFARQRAAEDRWADEMAQRSY